MSRQIWPSKSYELQVLKFLSEWLDLAQYLDSLCLGIVCSWSFDEFFQFLTLDFHLLTVQDFNFKCNGTIFSNASTHSHAREVNAHVALDDDNIRSTYRARENSAHRLIRITIILPPQNIKEIGINPKRARMVKDGEDIHGLQKYTSKRIFSSDITV